MKEKINKSNTSPLFFLPLGGCNEIGMNLNLYGFQGKWLMIDCGVSFEDKLGVDVVMPDTTFIEEKRKDLIALVLTHAHEDHIGAVPYLWERFQCPVFATPFCLRIVKNKLEEAGLLGQVPLHEVPLGGKIKLPPFDVEFLTLTHSIPEPNALVIRAGEHKVLHTGDWKLDPDPLVGNSAEIKRLKTLGQEGVTALVCDSTNVFVEGRTGSEASVREKLIDVVKKTHSGRIIIACFASNIARLETCLVAARESGRKAALAGRSLVRMDQAARETGYIKGFPPFFSEEEAAEMARDETFLICTGSQGEPRSALARIAYGNHPRLKLSAGDTVIFSARMIPGNEEPITRLQEALIEQGITVIRGEDMENIHVSGHPARDELKDMYAWVKPKISIPVHGEPAFLRAHAKLALECGAERTIIARNGSLLKIENDEIDYHEEVTSGRYALDGNRVVPMFSEQMKGRVKLMSAGVVFVTLMFDKNHRLRQSPLISQVGALEEGQEDELIPILQEALTEALQELDRELLKKSHVVEEVARVTVRRTLNALRGKKTVVMVHMTS